MKGKYTLSLLWQVFSIFWTRHSQKRRGKNWMEAYTEAFCGKTITFEAIIFTAVSMPGRLIEQGMLMSPPNLISAPVKKRWSLTKVPYCPWPKNTAGFFSL